VAAQTPDVSALQAQIQALEARLKKLEDRLEKPLTVKAPFTVTTDAGQAMFAVKATNGPELTLGSEATPALRVSHVGGRALLELRQGQYQAAMTVTSSDAIVLAGDPGRYVRLSTSAALGLGVEAFAGANRWANLGITAEGSTRLKLQDGGKQIFRVQGGQASELILGEDAAPALKASAAPEETTLSVLHGKSTVAMRASQNGDARFAALAGSGNRVAVFANGNGDSALQVDSGGESPSEWAQLVVDKNGPRAKLGRQGKPTAELGAPEGRHTGLRIYDPQGALALHAGLGTTGKASLSLWRSEEEASALLSTTDTGEGLLEIFRPGKQLAAQLGRTDQTKGTALRIYDTGGAVAVGAGIEADGSSGVLVASQGKYVAGMTAEKSGYGHIDITNNNRLVVSINNVSRKGDGALEIYDPASSNILASVGSAGGEGLLDLFRPGGKPAAQIGAPTGKATGLRIFDQGGNVAVGAGIDSLGRHSVTLAADGHQVARMLATTSGSGTVDVLAKGKSVASMGTVDDGKGVVNIFSGGTPIAALTLGANGGGLLQLGNAAGTPMVEAGTTASGVGLVRTGPMALPMLPGIPGSFILGKR
jgi:hypothetical protein